MQCADDYKFFPIFLVTGCLSYVISRWISFLQLMLNVQGALHHVASTFAGTRPTADCDETALRRWLFQHYRHLTLAHCLCYMPMDARLQKLKLEDLTLLGLLELDELPQVQSAGAADWLVVIGWMQAEATDGVRDGRLLPQQGMQVYAALEHLRTAIGSLRDQLDLNSPNAYGTQIRLAVDSLCLLVVSCYPVTLFIPNQCLQPWVVVGVALLFYSFQCASQLIVNLQNQTSLNGREVDVLGQDPQRADRWAVSLRGISLP